MRGKIVLLVLAVLALVGGVAAGEPVRGDFHGDLDVGGQKLAMGVHFADDGTATITIPAQGVQDEKLERVSADPDAIEWAIPGSQGDPEFRGRYLADQDRIDGTFSQSGKTFPLSMVRGPVAAPARPQEPHPPYPYRTDDVSYASGDLTIAGTLTRPNGPGPHPAVLLISGSGAQDRDEQILGHKPFLLLADTLTRAGYAVLRTDDRGVGGTGGDLERSNYPELAGDAAAGVRFLRGHEGIDPARVGLLGHSEGGYLAPLVASAPDSGVAFVILMAGPSVSGQDVLLEQNRELLAKSGAPQEEIDKQVAYVRRLTDLLRAGDRAGARAFAQQHNDEQPEAQRASPAALDSLTSPYMAALVSYDPAPALHALRVPVFAFYGSKDVQVPAAQNEGPMGDALAADPDHTVFTFPGLNHLMQPANTGLPGEYASNPITIAPEVLAGITAWLLPRFPPRID